MAINWLSDRNLEYVGGHDTGKALATATECQGWFFRLCRAGFDHLTAHALVAKYATWERGSQYIAELAEMRREYAS